MTLPIFDWDSVDWELNDTRIAKNLGCSRERVRQKRIQLKKPKPPTYQQMTKPTSVDRILPEIEKYNRHSLKSAAKILGVSTATVFKARNRKNIVSKIKGANLKMPRHLIDWRLPDGILTEIWGVKNRNVCRQNRIKCGNPKAEFGQVFRGRKPVNSPECLELVKKQKQVAQNWRKNESPIY